LSNGRENIKLKEEDISEILVADTDTVSGAETSDSEEEDQQWQVLAEVKSQAAVSGQLPTWETPQGRNKNIHSFVGPEYGVKKVRLYISTKTAHHCVLMKFFTETIHLLVEHTDVYYHQHLRQTSQT